MKSLRDNLEVRFIDWIKYKGIGEGCSNEKSFSDSVWNYFTRVCIHGGLVWINKVCKEILREEVDVVRRMYIVKRVHTKVVEELFD